MTVRHDDVVRPDGKRGVYGVVEKRDFVLIIPVYGGKLHLVKIFRYALNAESWEFPEGDWEPRESHRAAATRELLEETGFEPGKMVYLGHLWLAVGFCTQGLNVYLADNCTKQTSITDIDIAKLKGFTLTQVERMIRQTKIKDNATIAALYLYKEHLRR